MTTRNRNQNRKQQREVKGPDLIAWCVTERGERSFWTRIGAAWDHQNGEGMNLQLDLVPLDGRIVLLPPKADEDQEAGA